MYWKIDGILSSPQKHKRGSTSNTGFLPPINPARQKDTITRGSFLSAGQKSELSLSPCRMELFPGDSCDMVLTTSSDVPKVTTFRLVCQGFIGHESRQETIMTVDVTCRFVAPLLSLSTKKLNFYIKKVKGQSVLPVYEKLVLSNVSPLSLSMMLSLDAPFFLCDARGNHSATTKSIFLHNSSQTELWVCFNPAVYKDQATHIVDEVSLMLYLEHPHHYMVELHAEVHYPNLHFSSTVVDFGCVHKSTEANTEMTITNCSQLPVSYRWAFLDHRQHIKYIYSKISTFPPNSMIHIRKYIFILYTYYNHSKCIHVINYLTVEQLCSSSKTVSPFPSLPPILRHGEDENQKEVSKCSLLNTLGFPLNFQEVAKS
uniref:Uncharacterized protein n=1 Tax=Nothobranchius furzeri TaxID=105023 RepID=A0A8C6LXQ9_NOTFU